MGRRSQSVGAGEHPHVLLRPETQRLVERRRLPVGLHLDVRYTPLPAPPLDRLKQRPPDAPAPRFGLDVHLLDAGEVGARGDAGPKGEYGDPDEATTTMSGQNFEVAPIDGPRQPPGERGRHGLAAAQGFFEDLKGLAEFVGGNGTDLDGGCQRGSDAA